MPGKRRSGLANDRRAYGCNRFCHTTPVCQSITIADIATLLFESIVFESTWLLNKDVTILECQTLIIPPGTFLENESFSFTNYGQIKIQGILVNLANSTFINKSVINICSNGTLLCENNNNNNDGHINIAKDARLLILDGTIINNKIINNRGTITSISGKLINNIGTLYNNVDATIYNAHGSIITLIPGSIFTNNGILNNADGSSVCGFGTIDDNGVAIVGTGLIETNCPPPA